MWLFSWLDPGKEKEAAKALIDSGCDVLAMHADTGAVAQACEEAKVYVVGYNNDMSQYAPAMHLTAPIWNWEKLFAPVVRQVADGTWKSEAVWAGMKEGGGRPRAVRLRGSRGGAQARRGRSREDRERRVGRFHGADNNTY